MCSPSAHHIQAYCLCVAIASWSACEFKLLKGAQIKLRRIVRVERHGTLEISLMTLSRGTNTSTCLQIAITGLVCSKWAEKCLSSVLSVGLEVATKSSSLNIII